MDRDRSVAYRRDLRQREFQTIFRQTCGVASKWHLSNGSGPQNYVGFTHETSLQGHLGNGIRQAIRVKYKVYNG